MEKLLNNSYDKEYMKMAMLKHEETFREQVCELHRLYQTQKMLMRETAKHRINKSKQLNDDHNATTKALKSLEEENDLELTLGPKRYHMRAKTSETSISSCSTGSNKVKRTRSYAREESLMNQQKWGLGTTTMSNPSFLGGRKNGSEVEEHLRQDRLSGPPWLFQVLSMNLS